MLSHNILHCMYDTTIFSMHPSPCSIASGIQESCVDQDTAVRQLLLFTSALFPKALASLLTSTVIALSDPENVRFVVHYSTIRAMIIGYNTAVIAQSGLHNTAIYTRLIIQNQNKIRHMQERITTQCLATYSIYIQVKWRDTGITC